MEKHKNQLQVSVSNGSFTDEGEGVVSFPGGLTITDNSVMRSGTQYDIDSLDISKYGGQLTADHVDSLGTLIGKVSGVTKEANRVSIQSIKYAIKENPYARLAYDLLVGGFSNSFSIETIGDWPSMQDPVFRGHELVGLSQVVVPNNYNATVNGLQEAVRNSLELSKQSGLDVEELEGELLNSEEAPKKKKPEEEPKEDPEEPEETPEDPEEDPEETPEDPEETETPEEPDEEPEDTEEPEEDPEDKKTKKKPVEKNSAEDETETPEEHKEEPEAPEESEDSEETPEETPEEPEEESEDGESEKTENKINKQEEKLDMTPEQVQEIVANAVASAIKPVAESATKAAELAQDALDAQAKEPEFKAANSAQTDTTYNERASLVKQLNAAVRVERSYSPEAMQSWHKEKVASLNALKEAGIVANSLTLEDLGNFVIGPELYNEIATARTNYSAILDATNWRESDSIRYGWLTRSSDIDMKSVATGAYGSVASPDTSDKRLKPVSQPGYKSHTDDMEELAAVCPVPISTIEFAAADILDDIAAGFRNDFDRKRAQLVIARLQQAVDATGNKQTFDMSEGLEGWTMVVARAADHTSVGTLVMSNKTLALLKNQAIKTQNAAVLQEVAGGTLLGTPFIAVPNDLMPTLNTAETRKFSVNGTDVTVNSAVFYADLSTFSGRTHGGLKYDVDGRASYEMGGKVYSAFQRNELLIRGSFFRGGVVRDETVVASIPAVAVS